MLRVAIGALAALLVAALPASAETGKRGRKGDGTSSKATAPHDVQGKSTQRRGGCRVKKEERCAER